jgi:CRP-like cAMP-binding protein
MSRSTIFIGLYCGIVYNKSMDVLSELFKKGKTVSFTKNQVIMSPKKKPNGIYKITKGFIVTYILPATQKKRIQTILKRGDMFPLAWAIHNTNTNVYIEAITDGSAQMIKKEVFLKTIKQRQDAALEIISHLLVYLGIYMERVDNLEYDSVQKKVISRMLFFANRFGKKKGDAFTIELPLTHKFIAESINVSRENVTRELNVLEKNKIISFKNHQLTVLNSKQLQKFLEEN